MQPNDEESLEYRIYKLHKACWSGCTLIKPAVARYVAYVAEHCAEDHVTADHIRYAHLYMNMLERAAKKNGGKDAV